MGPRVLDTVVLDEALVDHKPAGVPWVRFDSCADNSHVVNAVGEIITEMLASNESRCIYNTLLTRFDAQKQPVITVKQYLERISKYAPCSSQCFTVSLIYIYRILELHPTFAVTHLNVHRLIVTSVMLAVKFFDDFYYNNAYYSKVGGVKPHEMNALELEFLFLINFDLQVEQETFLKVWTRLKPHCLCTERCNSAWNRKSFLRGARASETIMDADCEDDMIADAPKHLATVPTKLIDTTPVSHYTKEPLRDYANLTC